METRTNPTGRFSERPPVNIIINVACFRLLLRLDSLTGAAVVHHWFQRNFYFKSLHPMSAVHNVFERLGVVRGGW